ncbi:MAG TPA: GGDEF domain-containing protein [Streptosporangiaceae bacterium]|jgi:diguanylate cyclase (GGDEF)-like protein
MGSERCKRVREHVRAASGWPIWQLRPWLVAFIGLVTAIYVAAIVTAVVVEPWMAPWHNLWLFGALLLCTALTVEMTKRLGENAGLIKDVYTVWELPLAILLPPVYALVAPIFRFTLTQVRIRRIPLHRRVFSAAVVGLANLSASLVFHALTSQRIGIAPAVGSPATLWLLAVAVAAVTLWTVNTSLLFPAIKSSDPTVSLRELYLARERVHNDVAELCVAVLVTLGVAVTPLTILFAFPFVTLLQRSFRHVQLVNASRVDTKTGLLNAGTWEREAATEVARAVRTHTSLAVALIDIDHFKVVNDSYGHLAGDRALRTVARALAIPLREYDLVGRFGGEEFALLLPQTKALDAYRIAERIRTHIGSMPITVSDDAGAEPVRLSISIGVAALGTRWDGGSGAQLTELLAAADGALYQAKRNGRNQVYVVTENATLVASGRGTAENGAGGTPGVPEAAGPVTEVIQAS